jgi:hypothetical protein
MKAEVVPLRPSIFEAAANIAVAFAKVDTARNKAQSIRVEIGLELIELKRRVDAGEARKAGEPQEFWVWIKLRVNRSLQDMRKCIALAKAKDPEAAAAQEREDARGRMQKVRKERANSSRPAQVVKFDPLARIMDEIENLTDEDRTQLFVQLKEKYQW